MAMEEAPKKSAIQSENRGFKIRDYLYVGSRGLFLPIFYMLVFFLINSLVECAKRRDYLRRELDITHIVNTTSDSNDYPWDFIYLQV